MYVYMYVYVCICMYMYVYVCICMYACSYIRINLCIILIPGVWQELKHPAKTVQGPAPPDMFGAGVKSFLGVSLTGLEGKGYELCQSQLSTLG